jgi:hypothetical protein
MDAASSKVGISIPSFLEAEMIYCLWAPSSDTLREPKEAGKLAPLVWVSPRRSLEHAPYPLRKMWRNNHSKKQYSTPMSYQSERRSQGERY